MSRMAELAAEIEDLGSMGFQASEIADMIGFPEHQVQAVLDAAGIASDMECDNEPF